MDTNPIPQDKLSELWFAFRLNTWRRLSSTIKRQKLDQKAIATRLDMDEGQLSKILAGKTNITLRTLFNVARAIDHRLEIAMVPLKELPKPNYNYDFSGSLFVRENASDAEGSWTPAQTHRTSIEHVTR